MMIPGGGGSAALGRPLAALLVACCLWLVAFALLAGPLLNPSPRLVDLGAAGDAYLAASFYGPETTGSTSFRWSGPHSALTLPPYAGRSLISLRLHGAAAGQPIALATADGSVGAWPASSDWRVYSFLAETPAPGHAIQLYADLVRPGDADPRELGVAVDWVRFSPLPGAGDLPIALGEAARLAWALSLVGATLALVQTAIVPPPRRRLLPLLALLTPLGAALSAWAWLDRASLHWLLPLNLPLLGAATAALALLAVVGRPAPLAALRGLRRPAPLLGFALFAGAALLLLWSPAPMALRGAAALALLWAPGWLLAALLLPREDDPAMGLALRVCGALAGQVVMLLALAPWLGGRPWLVLATTLAAGALCAWLLQRTGAARAPLRPLPSRTLAAWALVLVVAAALRLPALGAAELHDDEASVLLAAAALVQGDPEVLLTQLKGPAQILLPAGPLALTGQLGELTARLPFAVAGLAAILAAMALARRLAGPAVAPLVVGLLLALDGLLIAFARIVQYQSLVMALSLGAYWCCWRFARGGPAGVRELSLAAIFVAVALLGHYDAIYVLPALLWLVVAGARRRGWGLTRSVRALAVPALVGAVLLAAFYLPFAAHPHAAETLGHLGERTGQSGAGWSLVNNLVPSYQLLTVYSTPAQVWAIALLAGGLVLAIVLAIARAPAAFILHPSAFILAVGPMLLWFAAGWLAMTFLIAQPRTHIYVAVVPAAILAAVAAAQLWRALRAPWPRYALAALALGTLVWAGIRQPLVFVRQSPEYIRVYPAARLVTLPGAPDSLPLDPAARFGFPGRDGWKAVGELYSSGLLRGAAASNQSSEVLAWYLRGQRRCGADPAVYLIALAAPNPAIPPGYLRTATIQVHGRDQLAVYQPSATAGQPRRIPLEPSVARFDERAIPPLPPASAACGAQ